MDLKSLGVTPDEITEMIEAQLYGRCVKLIRTIGAGNNIQFKSDGQELDIFIASGNTKIESVELNNLIFSPLDYKIAKSFAGNKLETALNIIKDYLRTCAETYILKPNVVMESVDVFQVIENKYKKISIGYIIKQAYEVPN